MQEKGREVNGSKSRARNRQRREVKGIEGKCRKAREEKKSK